MTDAVTSVDCRIEDPDGDSEALRQAQIGKPRSPPCGGGYRREGLPDFLPDDFGAPPLPGKRLRTPSTQISPAS